MLTQDRVKELLTYDPKTGVFRWKVNRSNIKAGSVAGCESLKNGKRYWLIRVDGKLFHAHRLAWLLMQGEFPLEQIDHIDGNGLNNQIENLRAVSTTENLRNQRKNSKNSSGAAGVRWYRPTRKWQARIKVGRKDIHLGYFADKSEAISARKAAEIKYGFHANHGTERPL